MSTVTGRYAYVACPCTTTPCLPGMAYAVQSDRLYYVTAGGHWFDDNRSWRGYTPQPDEAVTIDGEVQERTDAFGQPFLTIEPASLTRAR